jgi:AcrR family transcriptional regulator
VGETGILKAAIAVMAEHGYHGTSVRDIAERAGVSPAALYHHFGSKQEVLATIMERGIEALLRRTETALAAAGEAEVEWITARQQWAVRVCVAAGLDLVPCGAVLTAGELGRRSPYLPSGAYL